MSRVANKEIVRALLLVADTPLSIRKLEQVMAHDSDISANQIRAAIRELQDELASSSVELIEVASGYRLQVRKELAPWVGRLFEEKAQKYSRAFLETLALIVYRQPLTRGDIEEIRGVSISGNILKTMFEREWIHEVGHREGPGRPALLATTRQLLDDLNVRSLEDLPSLPELTDPEKLEAALVRLAPKDDLPQALKDQLRAQISHSSTSTEPADEKERRTSESELPQTTEETLRH